MKAYDYLQPILGKNKAMITKAEESDNNYFNPENPAGADNLPKNISITVVFENGTTLTKNFIKPLKGGFFKQISDVGNINMDNDINLQDYIGIEFMTEIYENKKGFKEFNTAEKLNDEVKKN